MRLGTKSVLFGAHAFWLHPIFVFFGWWKLFGFPWDPRLWVAFFIHDMGYWGKPNMDGKLGEAHPFWAARIMGRLFDRKQEIRFHFTFPLCQCGQHSVEAPGTKWSIFVLFHSRFLAKKWNWAPSKLCMADKLAVAMEPWWLYLPRVIATGEIKEYMALARDRGSKYGSERRRKRDFHSRLEWCVRMQSYCRDWALEHKDGRSDTWTPDAREARDETGVWK
jgi:hypothetical protein